MRLAPVLAALIAALGSGVATTSPGKPPPRCWGPKSIDPDKPCSNPALRSVVVPSVRDAFLQPASDCTPWRPARPDICTFGFPRKQARTRVALIGDSHAVHWRAALEVVARKHRWQGLSIYRSTCAFNLSDVHRLSGAKEKGCINHNRDVVRWMQGGNGIKWVVVSQHDPISASPDLTRARIEGYKDAWATLPANVQKIFVIRNPPQIADWSGDCVERVQRRRGNPGWECKEPRSTADGGDTAILAAQEPDVDPRVQIVDLQRFFCDERFCFPVVGGVLTHKDRGHITRTYSRLLGPYLNREMFPPSR